MRNTVRTFALILLAGLGAAGFETPSPEPASASLMPELISGPAFHIVEPVASDGLMHHYVIDSRFGRYDAYGQAALRVRLREITALTELSRTTDIEVVAQTLRMRVENDAKTVTQFVTNPVGTLIGIPQGIEHLFSGYQAQASEAVERAKADIGTRCPPQAAEDTCRSSRAARIAGQARSDAARYADRYLGLSAAERRYYQSLGVDPYTDNQTLRKTVHHLAMVEAATNLGLHFAHLHGVPYLGDVRRAMDTIYKEDPAVLRARQRQRLAQYGLTTEEIAHFENTLLLSPTRQALLVENARSLEGVAGLDGLFRHAMSLTTEEEVQVFFESTQLLVRLHASHPLARILAGPRIPAAQSHAGGIAVAAAFDAVYWTEAGARYEAELRSELPQDHPSLDLWLAGSVSPRALQELSARGWEVHDHAWKALPQAAAQADPSPAAAPDAQADGTSRAPRRP